MEALAAYSWPGNVRQLEHELERAAVVALMEDRIQLSDLSPEVRGVAGERVGDTSGGCLRDAVEQLERSLIIDAISTNAGNIKRSSEQLGLTRKGLRDKMARYGIVYRH